MDLAKRCLKLGLGARLHRALYQSSFEHALAIVYPPIRGVITYKVVDTNELYELAIVTTVLAVDSLTADVAIGIQTSAIGAQ